MCLPVILTNFVRSCKPFSLRLPFVSLSIVLASPSFMPSHRSCLSIVLASPSFFPHCSFPMVLSPSFFPCRFFPIVLFLLTPIVLSPFLSTLPSQHSFPTVPSRHHSCPHRSFLLHILSPPITHLATVHNTQTNPSLPQSLPHHPHSLPINQFIAFFIFIFDRREEKNFQYKT